MKAIEWTPQRRIEAQYQTALSRLSDRLMRLAGNISDPARFTQRLLEMCDEGWLLRFSEAAASRMVTGLQVSGAKTWREAARESMRGAELYRALREEMHGPVGYQVRKLVRDNADLIRSVPRDLAADITSHVMRESQKGRRSEYIAQDLHEWAPKLARYQVQRIARTETSKASTALTRARADDLDVPAYVWRTSEDAKVRPSHRKMDGVICFWNDAPAPEALAGEKSSLGHYNCGDAPNDRCYPEPLLRLSQVQWPCKVCRSGSITRMSRAAFAKIAGVEVAA